MRNTSLSSLELSEILCRAADVEDAYEDSGETAASASQEHTADTSASMIEAALCGSEERLHEAYVKFCERYFTTVRRWCSRHFPHDAASADDAASELMLNIYEKLKKYRPQQDKSFRSWLSVVTRNECADLRRRGRRHQRVTELTADHDLSVDEDDLIFDLLVDSERRLFIRSLLAKAASEISKRDRSILEGYLAERSPQQIADLNGMSRGAVYTAMSRIRGHLAEVISRLLQDYPGLELEDLINPA